MREYDAIKLTGERFAIKYAHMSVAGLANKLRQAGDVKSMSEILKDVRIAYSMMCLAPNSRRLCPNVQEVARRIGYQDGPSFRSAFKERAGMTPEEFKANATRQSIDMF